MSAPISIGWLREREVSRQKIWKQIANDYAMQTYYLGEPHSAVQLKIYNKLEQMKQTPEARHVIDLWDNADYIREQMFADHGIAGILLGGLVATIGAVIHVVWTCLDSQPGFNQYGPNPKGR
jgi:hypothetical protein